MNPSPPNRLTEADRGLARTLSAEGLIPSDRLDEILALYESSGAAETCATLAEFLVARGLVPAAGIADAPGTLTSLGRYRDLRIAGRGGMGVVYRAIDPELDRPVAIKVLSGLRPAGDPAQERFLREATIAGQLEHPNVVPVHEVGRTPDGRPFLCMKLIEGRSLAEVLDELRARPWKDRIAARRRRVADFLRVLDAIRYAHSRGIVHRDLKPGNVMIGAFGEVQVMDWGLAKRLGEPDRAAAPGAGAAGPGETLEGSMIGTPGYMPPEQADTVAGGIDERSDVFALGAILYEILTLTPPFRGADTPAVLRALLLGELEPPSARAPGARIPRDLEAAAMKALANEPAGRYGSVAAFQRDLEAWLEGRPLSVVRYRWSERAAKWIGRHQAVSAVAFAAVLFSLVLTAFFVRRLDLRRREAERSAGEATAARARAERSEDQARRRERRAIGLYGEALEEKGRGAFDRGETASAAVLLSGALAIEDRPGRRGAAVLALERAWRVRRFAGEGEGVPPIAWAPAGERLACRRAGGAIAIVDAGTGREVGTVPAADPPALLAAWSPDGTRLALMSATAVHVHELDPAREARFAEEPEAVRLTAFDWSPGGERLAVGGWDGVVRVLDGRTARVLARTEAASGPVLSVAWSADGRAIAGADAAGFARVWDPATGRSTFAEKGHADAALAVEWSPDGRLATASLDRTVRIWSPSDRTPSRVLAGHAGPIFAVAWSPDGRRLATASWDRTAAIWDDATGTRLASLPGHPGQVLAEAWRPDGHRLASGGEAGALRVWDAPTGRLVAALEGHAASVRQIAWSPAGTRLASADGDGTILLWDAPAHEAVLVEHGDAVMSIAWLPDGRLASGGSDGNLVLRDPTTGSPPLARPIWALGLDASPDGTRLVAAGAEGELRLLSAADGSVLAELPGHDGRIWDVAWSARGERIASGGEDRTVRIWDAAAGAPLAILTDHPADVAAVAWSPDGSIVAAGCVDGSIRLWDAASAREVAAHRPHDRGVTSIAWRPDGSALATGSVDRSVRILDPGTLETIRVLEVAGDTVTGVAWSPDGALLAAVARDGSLRIWDVASASLLAAVAGEWGFASSVAWSPDGRRLATAHADAAVRIWDLDLLAAAPPELAARARRRTGLVLDDLRTRPAPPAE